MDDPARAVDDIARTIERYLDANPHAFDTARGIAEWWLHDLRPPARAVDVRRAIDRLVGDGVLVPVALPDGQRGYSSGRTDRSQRPDRPDRPTNH